MHANTARIRVATAALLFSTGAVAIKGATLASWQIASLRSGIAAVVLWLFIPKWRALGLPRAWLVGVAYAGTMVLFVVANKLTTAANTIFLQSTSALWVMGLAPRLLGERNPPGDGVFAAVFAAALMLFFAFDDPASATAPHPALGNAVAATAGACWALCLVGLRWLGRDDARDGGERAGVAVIAGSLIACGASAPLAWPYEATRATDWAIVAYLGVFQVALAYVLMTRGVRQLSALEIALWLLIEPVATALWAAWIFDERPAAASLAACGMILAATLARTLLHARMAVRT